MPKRPNLGVDLDTFDIAQTGNTVIRICRKVFGDDEVIDCRLWYRNKLTNEYYPRRAQGICLKLKSWRSVLRVFKDKLNMESDAPQTNG